MPDPGAHWPSPRSHGNHLHWHGLVALLLHVWWAWVAFYGKWHVAEVCVFIPWMLPNRLQTPLGRHASHCVIPRFDVNESVVEHVQVTACGSPSSWTRPLPRQ